MKFNKISKKNQAFVKEQLEQHLQDINYDDVEIESSGEDHIIATYKDFKLKIPVRKPDQATSNNLWSVVVGGVLVLAGVAVALTLGGKTIINQATDE